ncbi:hypothetical protein [Mucilaginibacter gilvus]|uniref:Uncharacterized protein n=1 Tax=Mucilaginibacter gilvus TaxID=2305909 RepID=A0A444MS74_9SPHI|nr:hypothetical protein [Mucilaginibacter gilvus]RWY55442.1 hypothetical protein EPL05_03455 [Mucilaginibacter gilvus]
MEDTEGITIDDEAKLITFLKKNSLGNRTVEAVPFEQVFFTYRTQQISRYDKGDVCVIDSIKKTYAVLAPRQRGWQHADIRLLAEALSASKIKQITEKYDDKDIAL